MFGKNWGKTNKQTNKKPAVLCSLHNFLGDMLSFLHCKRYSVLSDKLVIFSSFIYDI